MKKYFLMVVMLLTASVSMFAEDNNAAEIERINKYNIRVNTSKLADCLQLTTDQIDAVETVSDELSNDMMFAATECNDKNRNAVTKNVVEKNIKHMSYILNGDQYRKYLTLLNVTLNNRNIKTDE
jgi:hypothetical protein